MSPLTRSKSKRLNEKDETYTQKYSQNTLKTSNNAESSAQAAARATTSLRKQQKQPMSSVTKKTPARQCCRKAIRLSQIEQEPGPQAPAAAAITKTNGAHKKTRVPLNDNHNDQDNNEDYEQDNIEQVSDENQQDRFSERQSFCFKGEGKFYLNFPLPVESAAISDTSLLCDNKSITFVPMLSTIKHHQHNETCEDGINNSSRHVKDDINRILGNLKYVVKAVKTLTGINENYRKRGYNARSDNYEQQEEDEQIPKRYHRAQSEDSEDDSLFTEISSRVLELRDQIKKGEAQLNSLQNQFGQLEKLYHEAFGVIHCNNRIARNAAVIQFSHKVNTIASNACSLWDSSDKLEENAKQLVDIFMDESFEGEGGGYVNNIRRYKENQ